MASRPRWIASGIRLAMVAGAMAAAIPAAAAPGAPPRSMPRLVEVQVDPARVTLLGRGASQILLVTGRYSDGSLRDLTRQARRRSLAPQVMTLSADGLAVIGKREGRGAVSVQVAGAPSVRVPVQVGGTHQERRISFLNEVIPVFTRAGCNQGKCHGTPTGKGTFRLSLLGYAPEMDWERIALEGGGRRAVKGEPGHSLLLLKPTATVPHGGGRRFSPGSLEFQILARWIAEGLRVDPPDAPRAVRIEMLPGPRLLEKPAVRQQLVAIVHFSDGSSRDVTRLCRFSSSDDDIATADDNGLVEARKRGEVAILCRFGNMVQPIRLTFRRPVPGFSWSPIRERNLVDRHVFAKLRLLRIVPSPVASDAEFLRRAYLDSIATLPTPDEARAFLADRDPGKRQKLVDRLLERPEFADFWALKWADLLRVKERALGGPAARAFSAWIRQSVADDKPLDQFVRDLVTSQGGGATSPPANYYRIDSTPEAWMEQTAQLFLGVRMQCARCHNHPFDRWTQDQYYAFAAFFAGVRSAGGSVYVGSGQVVQPRTGQVMIPTLLGGPELRQQAGADPRAPLAEWLTGPNNPWFARALANRVWYHVMGRGIVEPVDDFRESNPSVNDELLDALAAELVRNQFRLKPLVRLLMTSSTYELSAEPAALNADDNLYFSHAVVRMLTAEQLLDAISAGAGVWDVPRAIQIQSDRVPPFLEVFGRPNRNLTCECERSTDSSLFKALQLLTARAIDDKLRASTGRLAALAASQKSPGECVEELFLAFVSRFPTREERNDLAQLVAEQPERRAALEDLAWALVNSKEFMFRH